MVCTEPGFASSHSAQMRASGGGLRRSGPPQASTALAHGRARAVVAQGRVHRAVAVDAVARRSASMPKCRAGTRPMPPARPIPIHQPAAPCAVPPAAASSRTPRVRRTAPSGPPAYARSGRSAAARTAGRSRIRASSRRRPPAGRMPARRRNRHANDQPDRHPDHERLAQRVAEVLQGPVGHLVDVRDGDPAVRAGRPSRAASEARRRAISSRSAPRSAEPRPTSAAKSTRVRFDAAGHIQRK